MNFTSILLSSLTLTFCSFYDAVSANEGKKSLKPDLVNFNNMPVDILRYIYDFFTIQDRVNMRFINVSNFKSITLKRYVETIFKIAGLEDVKDYEPELAGVLRLSWTSHDPLLFFAALMEDVCGGNNTYKALFRPLVLHLLRTFKAFSPEEKQKYQNYLGESRTSFERKLAKMCAIKGHFDLVFYIIGDDKKLLTRFVSIFQNKNELFEVFGVNSQYAHQYLNALLTESNNGIQNTNEKQFGQWITYCIINNLDESYYIASFDVNPIVLEYMMNQLSRSTNVPESEYGRIHAQVVKLFENYSGVRANTHTFAAIRMINDIRFGSSEIQSFDFQSIDEYYHLNIVNAALLSKNEERFLKIYAKYKMIKGERAMDNIIRSFDKLSVNDFQVKNFKIIVEMLQSDYNNICKYFSYIVEFLLKLYAIKGIKYENSLATMEFLVSDNLLELGFPQIIEITKSVESWFFNEIFQQMKVFDESSIFFFMSDLFEYYKKIPSGDTSVFEVSIEILEIIANSPNILGLLSENGKKLHIRWDTQNLEKYPSFPNFHLTSKLIDWNRLNLWLWQTLHKLKSQADIEKIILLLGKPADESFLDMINFLIGINYLKEEYVEFCYFKLRSIFAYWLKFGNKQSIKEIPVKFKKFIEILKLDFTNETKEL